MGIGHSCGTGSNRSGLRWHPHPHPYPHQGTSSYGRTY